MNNATYLTFALASVLTAASGCQTAATELGTSQAESAVCSTTTTDLLAGQTIPVGTVTVTQDETNLCVRYDITDLAWYLTETQLHIADDPDLLPQTGSGNPQVGQFAHKHTGFHAQYDEFCIDYIAAGFSADQTLYIAAHAVVQKEVDGAVVQTETGWGEGDDFSGKNWAMYFDSTLASCQPDPICGWHTQTQDEWGEAADPAGDYMWNTFNNTFPWPGVTIGCDGHTISFQNRHPVVLHLPASGALRPLSAYEMSRPYLDGWATTDADGNLVPLYDPSFTTALFGQTAALALNIAYDQARTDFTATDLPYALADLVIVDPDSPCAEMTVAQVLDEAENVLFGCSTTFDAEQISACVTAVNAAFQDGGDGAVCTTLLGTPAIP